MSQPDFNLFTKNIGFSWKLSTFLLNSWKLFPPLGRLVWVSRSYSWSRWPRWFSVHTISFLSWCWSGTTSVVSRVGHHNSPQTLSSLFLSSSLLQLTPTTTTFFRCEYTELRIEGWWKKKIMRCIYTTSLLVMCIQDGLRGDE